MYSFDSRVRYSEADRSGNITLTAILDYFQDCSSFHSEDIGVGIDYLAGQRKVWVLNSWQIDIRRYAKYGERIQVATWPYGFKGFLGYRNFRMEDSQGELLACANTIWTLLDMDTMRPTRLLPRMEEAYQLSPQLPMENLPRKITLPAQMQGEEPFPVHKYHIDTNQHVNNGKYVSMAREYLPETFQVGRMRADYRRSAVYGDIIFPFTAREEGKIIVNLADADQAPYAIVELEEQK